MCTLACLRLLLLSKRIVIMMTMKHNISGIAMDDARVLVYFGEIVGVKVGGEIVG